MSEASRFYHLSAESQRLVRAQLDEAQDYDRALSRRVDSQLRSLQAQIKHWRSETAGMLDKIFGNTEQRYRFLSATAMLDMQRPYPMAFIQLESILSGGMNLLREYIAQPDAPSSRDLPAAASVSKGPVMPTPPKAGTSLPKVFLIHGHDEAMIHQVARFIQQIGCEPIVLKERTDGGRTIIEKFEQEADVQFAIVLMSPDDVIAGSGSKRSRQNVIFELGYFFGKLGRGRVMLFSRGDVEMPSDLHGIVYSVLDEYDGWKLRTVRELERAGIAVDRSRI